MAETSPGKESSSASMPIIDEDTIVTGGLPSSQHSSMSIKEDQCVSKLLPKDTTDPLDNVQTG